MITLDQCYDNHKEQSLLVPGALEENRGQCVQWVDYVLNEVYGQPYVWANAIDWWNNFDSFPQLKDNFTKITDGSIQKGDIVIFNTKVGSVYGHIDVAMQNGTTADFQGADSNWGGDKTVHLVHHTNASLILGSLRRKENNVITDKDVAPVRIVMSEVEGWNGNDIHSGKDDAQIMGAWVGHTWPEFIYHGWTVQAVHRQQLTDTIQNLQNTINTLSDRPTNEEYAKVQAQLNDQITALTAQLAAEKANIKTQTIYTQDEETKQNVSAIRVMVQAIFDYFAGQYKSFSKYNPFKK